MTLSAGTRLGPYEIRSALGAGGMGEVFLAGDSRLGREVALKVLPQDMASDPSRLKRFEKEARSASALNHPNIVTIYDIGSTDSVAWIAMERVEGKTLRELLFAGPLGVRRLLPLAAQIADGLAAAHEAGIVHRDLKPENVMVTKDGLVKILDFGLAKLAKTGSGSDEGSQLPTETGTTPGSIMGTVGYMSPEQASAHAVDFRSDQFSFGSILYEMVTGKRAFQKKTAVETLSAILNEEPEPIASVSPQAPVPLRWIVERCLAKDADARYASTKDLAHDLTGVGTHISDAASPAEALQRPFGHRSQILIAASLALAVVILGTLLMLQRSQPRPAASRLRFRQVAGQGVQDARFAPDGETYVYAGGGADSDLFMGRVGNPDSRSLGIPAVRLFSISSDGRMAFLLGEDQWRGTLAEAALAGGQPRELLENVRSADWSPDGKTLAVVRAVDGADRLEFPVGKVLYEKPASSLWQGIAIRSCRVSPKGDRVSLAEEPGRLLVIDRNGKLARLLSSGFAGHHAWSPDGSEIWYDTYAEGGATELHALTPGGRTRFLVSMPGGFQLKDVSRNGRALLEKGTFRTTLLGRLRGDDEERDLAHLEGTIPADLSADGSRFLFHESEGGGHHATVYWRDSRGPPVSLGRGLAIALSPDGKWAITLPSAVSEIVLLSTGPGTPRRLPNGGFETLGWANWLPDGRRILFAANAPGEQSRLYVQDLTGGLPKPITPQGVRLRGRGGSYVSPDGMSVVGWNTQDQTLIYPVDGGEPRPVRGLQPGETVVQWSGDGSRLFVVEKTIKAVHESTSVSLLNPSSGGRVLWRTFVGGSPDRLLIARDGKSYVRWYWTYFSNLFVLDGIQ